MKQGMPWLRLWRFWFGCILSLLCLWLAFRQTQLGELIQMVAEANPLFLLAALAAQLLVVMSRARRWVVLLKEDARFVDSFWAHSVGFLFTNVFPLRLGEPVRVLLMAQRCQLPVAQVAASAIGERLLDVVSNVLVLLVVLPWVQVPGLVRQAALSFSVVGLVGISMLLLVVRYESLSEKVLLSLCSRFSFLSTKKAGERWRELVRGFRSLTHRHTASQAVFWSLIPWAFAILVSWSVLRAFQPDARFVEAAFMVVALSFAVAVPSSPGFVGVFQLVGQQALMLPFGAKYDATSALAITLTAHLTYYIPTTILGVVGLWRLGGSFMTFGRTFIQAKEIDMDGRKSELYFEEIGEQFNTWISSYDVRQRIKLIKSFLPRSSSEMACLEVGCGTGVISEALAPAVSRLTVSDMSEKLARKVGERLGTDWSRQDACHLTIPDNTFDLVVSSECIEHTPDPRRALAEMARAVTKGGVLIVTSPNKLWYPALWVSMALKVRKFSGNEVWLYPWEAARVLQENGLGEIKLRGCHLFPWQLPLAKRILPLFDRFGSVLYPVMINYGIRATKS